MSTRCAGKQNEVGERESKHSGRLSCQGGESKGSHGSTDSWPYQSQQVWNNPEESSGGKMATDS